MQYRPEIDGLRALAVLAVILFHGGFSLFSGGFVGVDVFFVISGFLITSILLRYLREHRLSLLTFWNRRARRILPALVLVTFVTFLASISLLSPIEVDSIGTYLIGIATFSSNIIFDQGQGYFSEASELNPLLHTWSLAVEEQFYIVFPLLMAVFWRWGEKKTFTILAVLALISLAWSELSWHWGSGASFFLAHTRAWELLLGCLAAFASDKYQIRPNWAVSSVGLIGILVSILVYDAHTPFPGLAALLPTGATVLLVLFCSKETFVGRILSSRLVVYWGLISYSLYLWHQPLFALYRSWQDSIHISSLAFLALFAATWALADLTWRFVETPIRRYQTISRERTLIVSSSILIVIATLGLFTTQVKKGHEFILAETLSEAEYVYFSNLDERQFNAARLTYPPAEATSLVMGSSRLMQLGANVLKPGALNLSVSGASIEDFIALLGEAVSKLDPDVVFLGADPWLFNIHDNQNRWRSINDLYQHWKSCITPNLENTSNCEYPKLKRNDYDELLTQAGHLYWKIHDKDRLVADNSKYEAVGKKAFDGRHIYDENYALKSKAEIRATFANQSEYSMSPFRFDDSAKTLFINLITWLDAKGIKVILILPPYHPELYPTMADENAGYKLAEDEFIDLARRHGLELYGSYNPRSAGCTKAQFYDGMHPKAACFQEILDEYAG